MKIMITGSNGQLGNELQSILKTGKSEIGEMPKALENAKIFAVDVDTLDITDNDAVRRYVLEKKPNVIINCAAMTNVDGCESDYDTAFKVNAMGVRNLAQAAKANGSKFIHVSTDYVFAGDGTKPYVEWDQVDPQSAFAACAKLRTPIAFTLKAVS